jgi:hypothetical protein
MWGIRRCQAIFDLHSRIIQRLNTGALLWAEQEQRGLGTKCRKTGVRFGGDPKVCEPAIAEVRRILLDVSQLSPTDRRCRRPKVSSKSGLSELRE